MKALLRHACFVLLLAPFCALPSAGAQAQPEPQDARVANCVMRGGTPEGCAAAARSRPAAVQPAPAADCAQAEAHWKAAVKMKSAAAYQDHLARFPNCAFAAAARLSIEALAGNPPVPALRSDKADATTAYSVSIARTRTAQLKTETEKLGTPRIAGTEQVAGQDVPSLYFGETRINNNLALVADLAARVGSDKLAIFVRSGESFVSVATNLTLPNGRPALGNPLFIADKSLAALRAGEGVYGGRLYASDSANALMMGLEPIRNTEGAIIGAYEVMLSPMQYCEPPFPHGKRFLLSIDGQAAADLHGTTEGNTCEAISLSWSDGCNTNTTMVGISRTGDVSRSGGGSSTLLACRRPSDMPGLREFSAALAGLSHWRLDDRDRLVLQGGGHELLFGRDKPDR